ncbi:MULTISPECIES: hypothetical protein [unclassified Bartonella]|uniref:hypothetical protein n=1 Tax=unclassified Bartonella TaxID=2645622 RepID=UPI0035CF71FF
MGGSRNERAELLFHCGDNGVRYAFVLGGESFAGAWGIFLADMEKGEIRGFGKRNVGAG